MVGVRFLQNSSRLHLSYLLCYMILGKKDFPTEGN